ncbi:MAG: thiamine phosphate synthase [Myxococcota bacterium]
MTVGWRGFYAIVGHDSGGDPIGVAERILRAGPAVLQLRFKGEDDRLHLATARALRARCAAAGVPFVVNDRADLAALADADGLHLGQDDLPLAAAREIFPGPIGVSTHDAAQARQAVGEGADLIGFGPVFATATKKNPDPVVGLEGLRAVCAEAKVPVVAIGGIDVERARQARAAGAALVAAIGAVAGADDPEEAARRMVAAAGAEAR